MRDLAAVVERLRLVRAARGRFLRLWKLSRLSRLPAYLAAAPSALDRLAADVARAEPLAARPGTVRATEYRFHDGRCENDRATWFLRGDSPDDVG